MSVTSDNLGFRNVSTLMRTANGGGLMGFMDKLLEKSERKLLETTIEGLQSINKDIRYSIDSLTCAENSDFTHLALRADPPGQVLLFHRCRNIWYFSETSDGNDYLLLNGVDRLYVHLAIPQLYLLIESAISSAIEEEASAGDSAEPENEETSVKLESSPELNLEDTRNWLFNLMVRSGSDSQNATEYSARLAEERKINTEVTLEDGEDEKIGTLWTTGKKTNNKRASALIAHIHASREKLYLDGATNAEIVKWWDMPVAKQNLFRAQSYALMYARINVRLGEIDKSVKENRWDLAFIQARCTVPIFGDSALNDDGKIVEDSPLPWELLETVYAYFVKLASQENKTWELEAVQLRSFNAYYRRHKFDTFHEAINRSGTE
jgi:hypothetical protein